MSLPAHRFAMKWQNTIFAKLRSIPASTTDWPVFHQECVNLLKAYYGDMKANGISSNDSLLMEEPPATSSAQEVADSRADTLWIDKYYAQLRTTCLVSVLEAYVAGQTLEVGTGEEVRSAPKKFSGQCNNLLKSLEDSVVQKVPTLEANRNLKQLLTRCFTR